jgi:SnoaL-like domain
MKYILLSLIFCSTIVYGKSQDAEKLIRGFFTGFEKHNWDMVASQLSQDFTFTSPNGDDHITITQYKDKCWATARFFKKIEFIKIVVDGKTAFAMYNITATDNKIAHNVEYYTFSNGKIKSIETFFGAGVGYPGNSGNVK